MKISQVNHENLKVGKKYFIEFQLLKCDQSSIPYLFVDNGNRKIWLTEANPYFEIAPVTDPDVSIEDLNMVVEVASRLKSDYMARITHGYSSILKPDSEIAREAADLIAACKKIKEGER